MARDYRQEYQRRQERAQEEGFASDYDRRMRRGDPERELPSGEEAEYLRGHRGEEYLRDQAERHGEELHLVLEEGARDSQGQFTTLVLQSDDPFVEDKLISIRGLSLDELYDLFAELDAEGVAIEVNYIGEE